MRKGAITAQGVHMVIKILIGIFIFILLFAIAMGGTESVTAKIAEHSDCFKCLSVNKFSECFPLCWMI